MTGLLQFVSSPPLAPYLSTPVQPCKAAPAADAQAAVPAHPAQAQPRPPTLRPAMVWKRPVPLVEPGKEEFLSI